MVKAYRGVLEITDNGRVVKTAELKVNQPLYYRGYHFYLNTFSSRGSTLFVDLMVVSAQGVWLVFAGYAVIFIGVFGHFGRAAFAHRPVQEGVQ